MKYTILLSYEMIQIYNGAVNLFICILPIMHNTQIIYVSTASHPKHQVRWSIYIYRSIWCIFIIHARDRSRVLGPFATYIS